MPKWLQIVLGLVLSGGIFFGVTAVVYDSHPLRGSSFYERDRICRSSAQPDACYERFRREEARIDGQERWLGMGLGAAAVGLLWLLLYLFYIRPRRRAAGQAGPA